MHPCFPAHATEVTSDVCRRNCLWPKRSARSFCASPGIAAILSTQAPINSGAGLVGIALAHGLALSIAVSIFAGISGGHHNPAVTIGLLSTGRISPPLAVLYIVAQLVGATVAAFAVQGDLPGGSGECGQAGHSAAGRSG